MGTGVGGTGAQAGDGTNGKNETDGGKDGGETVWAGSSRAPPTGLKPRC